MKSKGWVIGLVVVVAAVLAVALDPTSVLWGGLRGETFFAGRPVTHWRKGLRSDDPAAQQAAVKGLHEGGVAALPVLLVLLDEKSSAGWDATEVRWRAADLIGQLGPEGASAGPALVGALSDGDPHVRTVAAGALGAVTPPKEPGGAVEALAALVPAGGPASVAASRALARFGPAAKAAIPSLREGMKDKDAEVAWNAMRALGKIGPDALEAVPALILALADEDVKVREHAAESLGEIGPAAKEAVPGLTARLKDPVARVRRDAVRSLGQIGAASRPALDEVKRLTKDEDAAVREAAGKAARLIEGDPAVKPAG